MPASCRWFIASPTALGTFPNGFGNLPQRLWEPFPTALGILPNGFGNPPQRLWGTILLSIEFQRFKHRIMCVKAMQCDPTDMWRIVVGEYSIRPIYKICQKIDGKIYGILSNESHPGMNTLMIYRCEDETRL